MKKINYYVIGGQYEYCCYGGTHTLADAKRLAEEKEEYWDNWQGWHKERIEQCKPLKSTRMNTTSTKPSVYATRKGKKHLHGMVCGTSYYKLIAKLEEEQK